MRQSLKQKPDFYAGGLMVLVGLGTVLKALDYDIGSLTHMGPGFFPVLLGVGLVLVGVLIAGSDATGAGDAKDPVVPTKPDLRGWLCVISGPLVFILLGRYGGLIPATFACVFVSALGDRSATLKGAGALAAGVTVFAVLLFSFVLHVPLPLLGWATS